MFSSIPRHVAGLALASACAAHAADTPPPLPAAASPSAQIAVRDAVTGRLRAPTPAEASALHAAGPQAMPGLRASQNLTRYHRSGAVGARLSDASMSFSVVVRQPDGRLAEYCFENRDAAEAAIAGTTPHPNALPTE